MSASSLSSVNVRKSSSFELWDADARISRRILENLAAGIQSMRSPGGKILSNAPRWADEKMIILEVIYYNQLPRSKITMSRRTRADTIVSQPTEGIYSFLSTCPASAPQDPPQFPGGNMRSGKPRPLFGDIPRSTSTGRSRTRGPRGPGLGLSIRPLPICSIRTVSASCCESTAKETRFRIPATYGSNEQKRPVEVYRPLPVYQLSN